MAELIEIDGSHLEGGGQIIRTALALSTLTGKGFKVSDIRKNRPSPGLKNQHLYCIKALKELCGAEVEGDTFGSTEVKFVPGHIVPKTIEVDIGTAGSITLMLQSLLLPSLVSGKPMNLRIKGGTDVRWSIPIDFFQNVVLPHFRKLGDIGISLEKRGFFPKGGGLVELRVKPNHDVNIETVESVLNKLRHEIYLDFSSQGELVQIKGISVASMQLQKAEVAERQASSARHFLTKYDVPVTIDSQYVQTDSPGSSITLWAVVSSRKDDATPDVVHTIGSDALGEKNKRAEEVGKEAALKLMKEIDSGASVDRHTADNLIPLLGLGSGKIGTSKITDHLKANMYVVEKFLEKKFSVEDNVVSSEKD